MSPLRTVAENEPSRFVTLNENNIIGGLFSSDSGSNHSEAYLNLIQQAVHPVDIASKPVHRKAFRRPDTVRDYGFHVDEHWNVDRFESPRITKRYLRC